MLCLSVKLLVSFIILLIALVGGLIPILMKINDKKQRLLNCGESFSKGIFLGAGFIHLLPEAQANLNNGFHTNYPVVFAVCACSILCLKIIEESAAKFLNLSKEMPHVLLAYLLIVLLSIHSVLEGAALGIETVLAGFLVIFFAIICHKGTAAFALGVQMRRSGLDRRISIKAMLLFSVMTPLGIMFGSYLSNILKTSSSNVTVAIFNAVVAGTFIYIAAFDAVKIDGLSPMNSRSGDLLYFAIGLIVMVIIAIWL